MIPYPEDRWEPEERTIDIGPGPVSEVMDKPPKGMPKSRPVRGFTNDPLEVARRPR